MNIFLPKCEDFDHQIEYLNKGIQFFKYDNQQQINLFQEPTNDSLNILSNHIQDYCQSSSEKFLNFVNLIQYNFNQQLRDEILIMVIFSHKHFMQSLINDDKREFKNGDILIGYLNEEKKFRELRDPNNPEPKQNYIILVRHCYRNCQDKDKRTAMIIHDPHCNESEYKSEYKSSKSKYELSALFVFLTKILFVTLVKTKIIIKTETETEKIKGKIKNINLFIGSSVLYRAINSANLFYQQLQEKKFVTVYKFISI